ncbi:MAG: M20 family metallopeptidase [Elusimicrobiota bacterium]
MTRNELEKYIINIRHKIHKYPELGFREFRTQKLILDELKKCGITASKTKTKTGVIATLRGTKKVKTGKALVIAFRADMDALPIIEETGKAYSSKIKGVMHACGHDTHVAMLLGAARLLSKRKSDFSGSVRFIFQPNEEGGDGAKHMISSGCLKSPKPDIIFGMHVAPSLPSGVLGLRYGAMMAAVDKINITLIGSGGHAAEPHKTQHTILASCVLVQELQNIISEKLNLNEPAVLSICTIHGGTGFNIIPKTIELSGTVRSISNATRKKIHAEMKKSVKNVCKKYGIKGNIDIEYVGDPLINIKSAVEKAHNAGRAVLGEKKIYYIDKTSMGGEDFADYLNYINGAFFYLGVKNADKNIVYPWHNPRFDVDEKALVLGAEIFVKIIEQNM